MTPHYTWHHTTHHTTHDTTLHTTLHMTSHYTPHYTWHHTTHDTTNHTTHDTTLYTTLHMTPHYTPHYTWLSTAPTPSIDPQHRLISHPDHINSGKIIIMDPKIWFQEIFQLNPDLVHKNDSPQKYYKKHIWEVFLCLHIVSKRCHFFLNFGALFEKLLNWSHKTEMFPSSEIVSRLKICHWFAYYYY